eukprot:TRINITY_DN22079_c0_g2_i3.p1 TRINITY_DN22079_c0_g2~~TRINITY_DN22079_c0_g2_i3.p1  ORF type:complete len:592 (+),score=155.44 TRINITY_DN22079_c0_g2_i3:376-2151(+)
MVAQEYYFMSSGKYKPELFGIPLLVTYFANTTGQELYSSVWEQVSRLVSPLPPGDRTGASNHATDCDDSLGYEYPFVLRAVKSGGAWCSWCPWSKMCRGCTIPDSSTPLSIPSSFLAIDWDPTALHLRYLAGAERSWREHTSVSASRRAATEPITLGKCLEAFTQEEHLGENEKVYCSNCKKEQMALKKLQIWRLPPILIIHLKRFQCVNNKWIKSHKIVDFPITGLDFTDYLAAVPSETLKRYKELSKRTSRLSTNLTSKAETIAEDLEPTPTTVSSNSDLSTAGTDCTSSTAGPDQLSEDGLSTDGARSQSQQSNNSTNNMDLEDPNDSGIESNMSYLPNNQQQMSSTGAVGSGSGTGSSSTSQSRLFDSGAAAGCSTGGTQLSFERMESNSGASSSADVFFDSGADDLSASFVSNNLAAGTSSTSSAVGGSAEEFTSSHLRNQQRNVTSRANANSRVRSISTSLAQHPIVDNDLQDFHQHNLEAGHHPLHIKYNMYAMVCHSGVLGGGHYVSYGKASGAKDTWYCHNDSSCKEVSVNNIDKSTAYILLYEREGLSISDYMPNLEGKEPDTSLLDEEFDTDFKKQCAIM